MIVGDTNLLVYLYVQSEFTERATRVHDRDPDWIFPPVALSETTNVLATLVHRKCMETRSADDALALMESRLATGTRAIAMRDVLQIAIDRGISAYDAQFVTLAYQTQTVLVTEDGKLRRLFPDVAISMESFLNTTRGGALQESRARYGSKASRRAR